MKIFYCGIQYDDFDPGRGLSFEHENFYESLVQYPGAKITYFPFEDILKKGKKRWNDELLAAVKKENPDLVFCFMFTDEFDVGALEELKKITTTLAWFADDHWRLENYSQKWVRHFTWV